MKSCSSTAVYTRITTISICCLLLLLCFSLQAQSPSFSGDSIWMEKPNKDVYKMDTSGQVGIGTTTPEARLQVAGAIRVPHPADPNISGAQTVDI